LFSHKSKLNKNNINSMLHYSRTSQGLRVCFGFAHM